MSALGAPRAKLIVSAAISRQYRNGYPARPAGAIFFRHARLARAGQDRAAGLWQRATSRSPWRYRTTTFAGTSAPPARRRAGLGPRRRGASYAPLPRRLGELQLRARGHRRGQPRQGRRHLPRARRRSRARARRPPVRRPLGRAESQDRLLVDLPDPEEAVRAAHELAAGEPRLPSRSPRALPPSRPSAVRPPRSRRPGPGPPRSSVGRPRPARACSARRPRASPGPRPRSSRPRWGSRRRARPWPPAPPSWPRRCPRSRR